MAADVTITKLNIEIEASAAGAKSGISAVDASLGRLSGSSTGAKKGLTGISASMALLAAKATVVFMALRRVTAAVSNWIRESNAYQENLNLFTVAMGKYANEAQKYAQTVSEAMGIDPSAWMRNEGIFMTLISGFGNTEEAAYKMSKNLTQLGYDLSSFFNISVADAMQKLQSGISGELEPLRRLGYDLSQTKLQQIAFNNGITQSVASMNQAQKAQLRYVAIMTQVTKAQGDMSRTLQSPANQLRIFQAAVTQAGRALGNMFIPALNAVLPYAIAFLNVIRTVANSIATLFGFQLTSVDYSGIDGATSSMDDLEKSTSGAGGAAKALKNYLMGIDELNVIQPDAGGGGGGGGGISGGGFDNLKLPEYTFMDVIQSKVQEIQKEMARWLPLLKTIGIALATVFGGLLLIRFIKGLSVATAALGAGGLVGATALATAAILGLFAAFASATIFTYKFTLAGKPLIGVLASLAVGFGLVGPLLAALIGPVGWLIAGVATLTGIIVGYALASKQLGEEQYAATQMAKDMAKVIEDSQGVIDRSAAGMDTLKSATQNYYDTVAQYGGVRQLVDEIFDLSEKAGKTSTEMQLLQTKVDLLNSMGLPDLTLSIDATTGAVEQTRDAISEVINKLDEQARMVALQDLLTEAYRNQYQAAMDYYSVAKPGMELAATAAETAKTKLDDMNTSIEGSVAKWRDLEKVDPLAGTIADLSTWWQKIQPDYKAAQAAVTDTTKALDLATQATSDAIGLFTESSDKITFATGEIASLGGEAEDASGYVSKLAEEIGKLANKPLIPPINIEVNYKTRYTGRIPVGSLRPELAANGGVFNEGQMFIAREAGPEYVGGFGSKTAVVNNDQIVEAVSQGVANAVSAVMGGQSSGDDRPIIVQIDGRQILTAVRSAEKSYGYQMSSSTVPR